MLAHDYATAITKQLEEGKELSEVLASLDRVLAKKGHEKLRSRILRELAHMHEGEAAKDAVVAVRQKADLEKFATEIEKAEKELDIKGKTETVVDPSIVGGFIIKTKEKQIDRSYKHALLTLYRSIITK